MGNKQIWVSLVVFLSCLAVAPRLWGQERTIDEILTDLARDPTIEEVQRAALKQAALEPQRVRSLLNRVRWAGILPRVEASLSQGYARDQDLDRTYQEMDELSLATDQDLDFRVSLRWDLDRLIFDPEELRARHEAAYQVQRRRELLIAVTRLYFELLSLRAQQECGTNSDEDGLANALRMIELRALLNGLTDGLVSRYQER